MQPERLALHAKAKISFLPNMNGYMAKLPPVVPGYLSTHDPVRARAGFTPAELETVFLTICRVNCGTYCMAAHSVIADKRSSVHADVLATLRAGEVLPDAKLHAVAAFTEAMVLSRGDPGRVVIDDFLAAGFTEQHDLGVVLAIACKTFSSM